MRRRKYAGESSRKSKGWSADSGHPPAVVIDGAADATVRFARDELRQYLARILGAAIPAQRCAGQPVIRISSAGKTGWEDEGYQLSGTAAEFRIQGEGAAGALYGVYEFLRRYCGCRFSGLAPDGERVPRLARIAVSGKPVRMRPRLWYRGFQFYSKADPALMVRRLDWMAKNGMNFAMVSPIPDNLPKGWSAETRDPATGHKLSKCRDGRYTFAWYRAHLRPEIRKRGLKVDMNHHNLLSWLPPEIYFKPHPEWYFLVNGQRQALPHQLCLCTSNAAAVAMVVANMRRFLQRNPETRIIGLIPEDWIGWCQCAACRALDDHADDALRPASALGVSMHKSPKAENRSKIRRYALFANAVARALRQEFPDLLVGVAAYVDIQWPPRDVTLEPNIVPWVALYWRCGAHVLGPQGCRVNRFFFDLLAQWRRAHRGRLILYEYYMGMGPQCSLPYPIFDVICREWPALKRLGLEGATVQSNDLLHEAYALNYLAFARHGWQDRVDRAALLDDYLAGMFGSAGAALRPIFERLREAVRKIERGQARSSYLTWTGNQEGCLLPEARNIGYFLAEVGESFIRRQIACARRAARPGRERRQVKRYADEVDFWKFCRDVFGGEARITQAEQAGDRKRAGVLAARALLDLEKRSGDLKAFDRQDGWHDFTLLRRRIEKLSSHLRQVADGDVLIRQGKLVLEVRLREPARVALTCDGRKEPAGILRAGHLLRRIANRSFRLATDRPAALDIRFNGRPVSIRRRSTVLGCPPSGKAAG